MNLSPKTVHRRLAKIPQSQAKLTFLVLHTWLQLGASMGSVITDKHDLLSWFTRWVEGLLVVVGLQRLGGCSGVFSNIYELRNEIVSRTCIWSRARMELANQKDRVSAFPSDSGTMRQLWPCQKGIRVQACLLWVTTILFFSSSNQPQAPGILLPWWIEWALERCCSYGRNHWRWTV